MGIGGGTVHHRTDDLQDRASARFLLGSASNVVPFHVHVTSRACKLFTSVLRDVAQLGLVLRHPCFMVRSRCTKCDGELMTGEHGGRQLGQMELELCRVCCDRSRSGECRNWHSYMSDQGGLLRCQLKRRSAHSTGTEAVIMEREMCVRR